MIRMGAFKLISHGGAEWRDRVSSPGLLVPGNGDAVTSVATRMSLTRSEEKMNLNRDNLPVNRGNSPTSIAAGPTVTGPEPASEAAPRTRRMRRCS